MKSLKMLFVASLTLLLIGCAAGTPLGKRTADRDAASVAADADAEALALERQRRLAFDALSDPSSPLSNRVIYFDYDKSDIRSEFVDMVNAHGRHLADNPTLSVRVEGHTDERGSREYNIALGERRANAVRSVLMANGARAGQIQVISYGEEMPVAFGRDEESWSLNRRAELIYEGR